MSEENKPEETPKKHPDKNFLSPITSIFHNVFFGDNDGKAKARNKVAALCSFAGTLLSITSLAATIAFPPIAPALLLAAGVANTLSGIAWTASTKTFIDPEKLDSSDTANFGAGLLCVLGSLLGVTAGLLSTFGLGPVLPVLGLLASEVGVNLTNIASAAATFQDLMFARIDQLSTIVSSLSSLLWVGAAASDSESSIWDKVAATTSMFAGGVAIVSGVVGLTALLGPAAPLVFTGLMFGGAVVSEVAWTSSAFANDSNKVHPGEGSNYKIKVELQSSQDTAPGVGEGQKQEQGQEQKLGSQNEPKQSPHNSSNNPNQVHPQNHATTPDPRPPGPTSGPKGPDP